MPLLDIRNLSLTLGSAKLLHDISLSIDSGEVVALVGESGSGKSLTAMSILGLQPDGAERSGQILLDSQDLIGLSDTAMQKVRGAKIGMVFQEPLSALNPVMTIGNQVAETVRIHTGCSHKQGLLAARKALDDTGLPAPRFGLGLYPYQLSGGQRQRVAIAMTTALEPRLLIADEATSALDPVNQAKVLDLLCGMAKARGMGLLLILHDLAVAQERADRVVLIRHGQMVETVPAGNLTAAFSSDYGRALIRDATHTPAHGTNRASDDTPVLQACNVTRTYQSPRHLFKKPVPLVAVNDVSLTIRKGERVGLIGESGCGKSTLLRALIGLEPVQAGQVLMGNQDWAHANPVQKKAMRRRVQPVFQDPGASLDPRWTVARSLAEPLHLLETPLTSEQIEARIAEVLEQVGLPANFASRLPHKMSGGQKQRVALARAIITKPDLIVMDEAVSALDVTVRARILDLLADLSARLEIALLFVSHDLEVVRRLTQRVLVMEEGRIVEQGDSETVLANPAHLATQRLLAATPRLMTEPEPSA